MHVSEVVFPLDVVLMVTYELVFIGKFEEDGEKAEELFDDFRVAFLIDLSTKELISKPCLGYVPC